MRGSTMQVLLLVLGLLSLMTPLACAQDQPYQDVLNRFIQEYNRKSESESLFRLSTLNLPPEELVKQCIGTNDLDSPNPSVDISCDRPAKVKRGLWDSIKKRMEVLREYIQQFKIKI